MDFKTQPSLHLAGLRTYVKRTLTTEWILDASFLKSRDDHALMLNGGSLVTVKGFSSFIN